MSLDGFIFGDGDRVAGRRVDDGDAEPGCGSHVDVVDAHAGATDDPYPGASLEQLPETLVALRPSSAS